MAAQARSSITGSRITVTDVREHGILTLADGAIELEDVRIARVFETRSGGSPFGHGATVIDSRLRLTRFEIVSPDYCGVFLGRNAGAEIDVDLMMGRVEGARIGACVQAPGYDLMRLTDSVEYVDNDVNLDTTSLPTPTAVGEIEDL